MEDDNGSATDSWHLKTTEMCPPLSRGSREPAAFRESAG